MFFKTKSILYMVVVCFLRLLNFTCLTHAVYESKSHSVMSNSATPWTIESIEFSKSEYWCGYPFSSPGDLSNPGIKSRSSALQAVSLPAEPQGDLQLLKCVAFPFSSGSSWPRNQTGSSTLQADSLPIELSGKPHVIYKVFNLWLS